MTEQFLLPTRYGKYPYFGQTADATDPQQTKYGGHEGAYLTMRARALAPGVVRVSWTTPTTMFTQFQLRRGSLTYPDSENSGTLLLDEFVGGGTLDDTVPELTNAYYAFFGLDETTSTWIMIGKAWCLVPKDTGSVRALIDSIPRTFFTGGAVYDPLDPDSTMYRFLAGMAFMFDLLKSESFVIYDYPSNTSERALLHVLRALGDEPVNLSPISNRRLISVMRHAQQRKGTLESIEEISSALTGYNCRIRKDIITGAPILDNMVLSVNDASPYSTSTDVTVAASAGTATAVTAGVTLAAPPGGVIQADWAWRVATSSTSCIFGTDTGTEPLKVIDLYRLIPINEEQTLTFSVVYKYISGTPDLGLVLRFYDRSGTLIPINEVVETPTPDPGPATPPVGGPDGNGTQATVYVGPTRYDDVELSTTTVDPDVVGSLNGFQRIYGTTRAPIGAVYVSWHVLLKTNPSTVDILGAQLSRGGDLTHYADPRAMSVLMPPARVNLAPSGNGGSTYGWATDSDMYLLDDGHYSAESLQFTPPVGGAVSAQYPVDGSDHLLPPAKGWKTIGLSLKTSIDAPVRIAWLSQGGSGTEMAFDDEWGYAFDAAGVRVLATMTVESTDEWQTVTLSGYSELGSAAYTPFVMIICDSPDVAVYIDNVVIEQGSVVGGFFDGDNPDGMWMGTAGESASALYPDMIARTAALQHYLDGFVALPVSYRLSDITDPDYVDSESGPQYPIGDDPWVIADDWRVSSDAGG